MSLGSRHRRTPRTIVVPRLVSIRSICWVAARSACDQSLRLLFEINAAFNRFVRYLKLTLMPPGMPRPICSPSSFAFVAPQWVLSAALW